MVGHLTGPRTLSVVIPAFNEAATIRATVERVCTADVGDLRLEVIVVDDGSRDGTADVLASVDGIRVIRHEINRGKGAAVKTGFAAATGEIVLIQDADLEYDPRDYKVVVQPIVEGRVEAVMGSRFSFERPHFFFGPAKSPFFTHYVGNLAIIWLTNLLYRANATDYEGCYKAFTRRLVRSVPVEADGFEYDNELVCKLLRRGYRIEEVPISYQPRSYQEGKKIRWTHGLRMIWTILKWRVKPF